MNIFGKRGTTTRGDNCDKLPGDVATDRNPGGRRQIEIGWMHPPKCNVDCSGGARIKQALDEVSREMGKRGIAVVVSDLTRIDDGSKTCDGWESDQSNRFYLNGRTIGEVFPKMRFCDVPCRVDGSTTCYWTRSKDGPKGNPGFLIRIAVLHDVGPG